MENERRHGTVLWAEISGFAETSGARDPDELGACWTALAALIAAHGGRVDGYVGGRVCGVFGMLASAEDAPRQAVNVAIALREHVERLNEARRGEFPLELSVGIDSGPLLAGPAGGAAEAAATVRGDTIASASRLLDAAPDDCILVGPQTHRLTRDVFAYRELRPGSLQGAVVAYELLSAAPRTHRRRGGLSSPYVGRERELARLRRCVADLAAGRGGIVTLAGEAGLGKSRLLAELATLDECARATVLEGRALSMGQGLAYHPFVDLIRHWARITEGDGEGEAYDRLEAAVQRVCPATVGEVFPFVATLMGMRLSGAHAERVGGVTGEAMEKLIFKSTMDLLRAGADETPLVLIFEDLHWADLSSINLLESLQRLAVDAPILFVYAFRPDEQGVAAHVARAARARFAGVHVEMQLQPLDARECHELVRNLAGADGVPQALHGLIAARSGGNPFFIEEMVHSLEGAEDAGSIVVPETIGALIAARMDRLPEAARHLARLAAVVGQSFSHRLVEAIAGDAGDLDRHLWLLTHRGLILERQPRGERQYVFRHALAQQAIYESIPQPTRARLHRQVAAALEEQFADRLADAYGMLAYHYSRTDDLEKAEAYLFRAGDEAARSAASSEALGYFREASRLYLLIHGAGGDPLKVRLLEKNIGLALLNTGQLLDSITHFDRALDLLGEPVPRGTIRSVSRFAVDLAIVLYRLYVASGPTPAVGAMEHEFADLTEGKLKAEASSNPRRFLMDTIHGLRRLTEMNPRTLEPACSLYAGGAAAFAFGGLSFSVSERLLGLARDRVGPRGVRDRFVLGSMQFIHHFLRGDWDDRHAVDDALMAECLRYGLLWDVQTYLGISCERKIRQGKFEGARADIARLTEIGDVYAYDFARTNQHAMTAFLHLEQRNLADALGAVTVYYETRHEEVLNLLALGIRAKIETLGHDLDAAEVTLAKAAALNRRLGIVTPYHAGAYIMSRFLLAVTAVEGTARRDRRTVRLARRSGRRAIWLAGRLARERTEAYRLAGRLDWLTGRPRRALRWWRRSLEEGTRLGARPEVARTCHEIGRRLSEPTSRHRTLGGMPAAAYLEKARALFAELNLRSDLEQPSR